MHANEVPLTLTTFPRLGARGIFTDPYYPPGGPVSRSLFLPDEVTNPHVRFPSVLFSSPFFLSYRTSTYRLIFLSDM